MQSSFPAELSRSRSLRPADRAALRPLGVVGSGYLVLIVLIATLAPFNLAWPQRFALDFEVRELDLLLNLLMLMPLGFIQALGLRNCDRDGRRGLLLGLLLSLAVESVQLFLPQRRPSPFDLIANAGGAWLGALLYARHRSWVDARVIALLRAQPPLAVLPFAILPVMWLDGFAAREPLHAALTLPLGIAGACVAAATWPRVRRGVGLVVQVVAWYLCGCLPALALASVFSWPWVVIGCAAVALTARFLGEPARSSTQQEREQLALVRCAPLLLLYMIGVAVWPLDVGYELHWTAGFMTFDSSSRQMMLCFLEYLGAFTLLGYLVALIDHGAGRVAGPESVGRVALAAVLLGSALELLRGLGEGQPASLMALGLVVLAAVSGACLHAAQRRVTERELGRSIAPPPRSSLA